MPVERRGLAVNMRSKKRSVPLGQMSHYGTVAALGICGCVAKCPCQENPVAGQTHSFETEALPEGEVGLTTCVCLQVKFTGKPDEGNLHVRFDEGESDRLCMACLLFATPPERADTTEVGGLNIILSSLYSTGANGGQQSIHAIMANGALQRI